ncbi:MAG: ABC transporter substrate-binding protein [Acidimicrobiales bacterium]|nr:ABC transporter substrate-binding protein [Acidimicrobiales bacterium]
MRTTRSRLAALAVVALLLAACSESVKDDTADGGSATTTPAGEEPKTRTTRGVTDDTILVGGTVYDLYYGDARVGVEARLKELNDAGGVHGRKIEVVDIANDNNEATRSLQNVQRLVEQEKVFALLPVMSGGFGGGDFIVDKGIPTFGWGTHPAFCDNTIAFGFTGCVTDPSLKRGSNALGTGLEKLLGTTDQTIAFLGEDNDSSKGGVELLAASVKDKGFDVVLQDTSIPAPPDILGDESPFVSKVMKADDGNPPDIVYLLATLSGTKLAAGLQGAGFKGKIFTPSYSPLLLGAPGYDGVFVNTQFSMDPEVPANAAMLKAVRAVKPDAQLNLAISAGYWTTDFFISALEKTGKDLTVEKLLQTLNDGFTYEVPDVVGKSTWPANHELSVPCSAITEVKGKEFVPVVPLTCGENIDVN